MLIEPKSPINKFGKFRIDIIDDILEKNKTIAYTIITFALLPFVGSFCISTYLTGEELPAFLENAKAFPLQIICIYLICSLFMSFSLVVNTLIIVVGAYYLKFYSLIYLSPAYMLACAIGYGVGKIMPKEAVLKLIEEVPELKTIAENMQNSQVSTVGLTKMSPILPFVVTNALFGILNFNFRKFMIGSFLGKWPRVLLFTFIGTTISSFKELSSKSYGKEWWVWAIGIVIFAISIAGLYFTVVKGKDTSEKEVL